MIRAVKRNFSAPLLLTGFLLVGLVALTLLSGCARPIERPLMDTPLSFEVAIRMITFDLFAQIKNQQSAHGNAPVALVSNAVSQLKNKQQYGSRFAPVSFAIDAVINADTGEEIELNNRIREIVTATAGKSFPNFSVMEMNTDTINQADYVIIGVIKEEIYNNQPDKFPRLFLSAVNMKNGQVNAHSEVWISLQDMKFEPTALYSDSPMFVKDARTEKVIQTAKADAGSVVDREYIATVETNGLLAEASKAYGSGDYQLAVELFEKAAAREDGQVMKTYAGLYQSYYKLNQLAEAEHAFAQLTAIGIENGNLSVKFLFQVDDTSFFGQPEEISEYRIWLRQIAKQIADSDSCIEISGHASRSGSATYNKRLSDRRARMIQNRLMEVTPSIAQKTVAVGRGFENNIVGSGTDDIRDSIDRRVEFRVMDCQTIAQ